MVDILSGLAIMVEEMFRSRPIGPIIGVLFLASVLVLVFLAVVGLFLAADSWFVPRNRKVGRVVGKKFTQAHTCHLYHPDDWLVIVDVDGQQGSISVSREFFNSVSENDPVLTEYFIGRFSKNFCIKALSRA